MTNDNHTAATAVLSPRSTIEMNNIISNNVNKCVQSSPSLKRKRPSKLEIPNVLREICTDPRLDYSSTTQDDAICFGSHGVGVFSLKGKKKFMEDTHRVVSSPYSRKAFFGVYDGHGGRKAAEFVADKLHSNIYEMLENCGENEAKEAAVKAGYLKTDQEFLKQGLGSGACCVTALIEGKEILVSNLGDCRAVLCRGGTAEALTIDHRAGQEDERRRVDNQGGYVEMHRGAWRIHGILSVSRSIGDAHLKDWVPAEPDTKTVKLTPDMKYLILASDGLWEEVGNQEAVDLVIQSCSRRQKGQATPKENGDEFGCMSPLSRSRRVVFVKCKRAGQSPGSMKTFSRMKESEDYFGSENEIPPSKTRHISEKDQTKVKMESPNKEDSDVKARLISEMDQAKMKAQSPSNEKSDLKAWHVSATVKESEDYFGSENEIPPSKARHVSEKDRTKVKMESPNKEDSDVKAWLISEMDQAQMKAQYPSNEKSDFKARRVSETYQTKAKVQSPNKESSDFKGRHISEMDQAMVKIRSPNIENRNFMPRCISEKYHAKLKVQSPNKENSDPIAQRVSEKDQAKMKVQSPNKENIDFIAGHMSEMDQAKKKMQSLDKENNDVRARPACGGLVAACKDLVNLAVTRGSLDDITVMIIDLTHFME